MPAFRGCPEVPDEIRRRNVCLYAVSKNVEGALDLLDSDQEECPELDCRTLKTLHVLRLSASSNPPCDSKEGAPLDGRLYAVNLTHAFSNGDGNERGFHAADFRWKGSGLYATGRLSGITNAGTHRPPVFDDCQRCDAHGWMEGRFCGTIVRAVEQRFVGCQLIGTYRLRFDPSSKGGQGAVRGTLEGLIVCDCSQQCVDFAGFPVGTAANPRVEQGLVFTVMDGTGAPAPATQVRASGSFIGLDVSFTTQVQLPGPASAVDVTLVHFSSPARAEAYDATGTLLGAASMSGPQGIAETLSVAGAGIVRVAIVAPQDETLLLRLCPSAAQE